MAAVAFLWVLIKNLSLNARFCHRKCLRKFTVQSGKCSRLLKQKTTPCAFWGAWSGGGVPEISEIIRKHSLQVGKDFLSKEGLLCWEMAREEQIPFWTQALMHRKGIQTCQCRRVYGV